MTTKKCAKCHQILDVSNFRTLKSGRPSSYCRECLRAMARTYAKVKRPEYAKCYYHEKKSKDPEKIKEYAREWREKHPGYANKYYKPSPIVTKICVHCGKDFQTNSPNHKACSRQCKPKPKIELKKNLTYTAEHPGRGLCNKCGKELPIDSFPKRKYKDGSIGYYNQCKKCHGAIVRAWKDAHAKPPLIKVCERCGKEYNTINPNQKYCAEYCGDKTRKHTNDLSTLTPEQRKQHLSQYYKQWYAGNKDKVAKWNIENKERIRASRKACIAANKDRYRGYKREAKKRRMQNDIDYRLKVRISQKIRTTINGQKLYKHSIDLLGCSVAEVRQHLQRQFQHGMTWDNWGVKGWHIDHIIPISSFDFTDIEQQKRCFHYTNLQPLWWMDNIMKADKIEQQQLMLM